VIGKCHRDGEGARKLLEWEGFSFSNVIDIFDGGPLVSAPRDHIRTKRESRLVRLQTGANLEGAKRALVAVPRLKDYRCVSARVVRDGDAYATDADTLRALSVKDGDDALIWIDNAH
jgi:arginine N-succinyltransferase